MILVEFYETTMTKVRTDWQGVTTSTAANKLSCTVEHLRNLRKEGVFKIGQHYKDISRPGAGRPTYRWNLEACSQYFDIPPEQRA